MGQDQVILQAFHDLQAGHFHPWVGWERATGMEYSVTGTGGKGRGNKAGIQVEMKLSVKDKFAY